jgi:hypothetical protein
MDRASFPKGLSDSPEFGVHGTSEPSVEEQIPARMIVVVVDVNFVSTPIPVAATRNVIIGYDPGGAVVEDDTAHARFIGANDIDAAHMVVATVGIAIAETNAVVVILVVPPVVMGIMGIVPTPVPTVVVAVPVVIIAVVLVPTFVPAVVVVVIVVAVSLRRSETQASR